MPVCTAVSALPGRRRALSAPRLRVAAIVAAAVPLVPARVARAQESTSGACAALAGEVAGLRLETVALVRQLKERDDANEGFQREAKADLSALKERVAAFAGQPLLAGAFLASPPPSSDTLGVAKTPVFAPRLNVDAVRRHDTLYLKLRRIEPGAVKLVAELELSAGEPSLDLPVDQNGALYVLEWSTSEGFSYTLTLRDGASDQTAASVQVRPLQNQGRLLYVASRLE